MRARSLLLCSVVLCSLSAAEPGLLEVKSIYLLPMTGGLDQYLANKLTGSERFRVVTDPEKADAIFTDRLGADFEERMQELYPPPPPPKEETDPEKKDEEEDDSMATLLGETTGVARISSFSRGKGNVFLVDRHSRVVLWSHYQRPESTRPDDLDHVAEVIAEKLNEQAKKMFKAAAKADRKAIETINETPSPVGPATPAAPAPVGPATPAAPASPAPQPDKSPQVSK